MFSMCRTDPVFEHIAVALFASDIIHRLINMTTMKLIGQSITDAFPCIGVREDDP